MESSRILQQYLHNVWWRNKVVCLAFLKPGIFLVLFALPIAGKGQTVSLDNASFSNPVSLSDFDNEPDLPTQQTALSENYLNNAPNDTSEVDMNKAAKAAALKSMVIPGWGQVENGQVWKVPILYAGLGICAYAISFNHSHYKEFEKAYRLRTDGDTTTIDKFDPQTGGAIIRSDEVLRNSREFYRRNRTLSYIATGLVWAANILDAYVFAHLKEFDVSDDLSMKVNPPNFANIANRNHVTMGISLKLKP